MAQKEPAQKDGKKISRQAIQEGASDTVLNAVSILGEVFEDFKSSDKFFKYKAMVLAVWVFSCFTSVGVACSGGGSRNDIGARLISTSASGQTVYAVKNDGAEAWHEIEIVVNGHFRSTLASLESNDSMTLSPTLLFDANGTRAPANLAMDAIVINVTSPEDKVVLLEEGKPTDTH